MLMTLQSLSIHLHVWWILSFQFRLSNMRMCCFSLSYKIVTWIHSKHQSCESPSVKHWPTSACTLSVFLWTEFEAPLVYPKLDGAVEKDEVSLIHKITNLSLFLLQVSGEGESWGPSFYHPKQTPSQQPETLCASWWEAHLRHQQGHTSTSNVV